MAELLVYRGPHWMDSLTVEQITELGKTDKHFAEKYAARYRPGDIVEVRPDGYWSKTHGWNRRAFNLLRLPGVTVRDAQYLTSAKEVVTNPGTITETRTLEARRRYRVTTVFDVQDKTGSLLDVEDKGG